jgi:hypothetical protein
LGKNLYVPAVIGTCGNVHYEYLKNVGRPVMTLDAFLYYRNRFSAILDFHTLPTYTFCSILHTGYHKAALPKLKTPSKGIPRLLLLLLTALELSLGGSTDKTSKKTYT